MNARLLIMTVLAGLTVSVLPARADTTIKSDDASVELTVPNGWRQPKTAAPAIPIQATDGRAMVLVRVAQKEDYKDLKSFAQVGSQRFMKSLTDAEPKFEDVQINGKPAIRVTAEGTQSNGMRRGFVITFIDTDGVFIEIVGIAGASAFKVEQQAMSDMAGKVKILAATQAPSAPPRAANTPSTPAPAAQPPTGRQPR
jgi:hypothetical protein